MKDSPCHYCSDRRVGCHSECEKYKAFKAECEEERQKRLKDNEFNGYKSRSAEKRLRHRLNHNKRRK